MEGSWLAAEVNPVKAGSRPACVRARPCRCTHGPTVRLARRQLGIRKGAVVCAHCAGEHAAMLRRQTQSESARFVLRSFHPKVAHMTRGKSSSPTSRTRSAARKNARSLDEIADCINELERANVIDIGNLLLEAHSQCAHGEWLAWLGSEFEWSEDTAARFMKVAKLAARFRKLRNLKIGKTTLYALADHEPAEDLPEIIKELAKHATKIRLAPRAATPLIDIAIGRGRFGDHPDATLSALVGLDEDESWYKKAVAALIEHEPTTKETADSIISDAMDDDTEEIEGILDGRPPLRCRHRHPPRRRN
jgi:Protein of unknown function (DUF3102)